MRSGLITAAGSFGSIAVDMPPTRNDLRMRILAAQHRVDANEILLPRERFQVMRHRQQIHFRRQNDMRDGPNSRWRTDSIARFPPRL